MLKLLTIIVTWTAVIEGSLPPDDGDNVLHIGGIFPIAGEGGWQGGQVSNDRPFNVDQELDPASLLFFHTFSCFSPSSRKIAFFFRTCFPFNRLACRP